MPNPSWNSLASVSAFDARLAAALREAAATTLQNHPEVLGVWLFGSRARGNPGPRSDVDLLILASRAASRMMDRPLDYRDLLDRIPAPVDLLVITPAELHEHAAAPFYRRLIREAVVLARRETPSDPGRLLDSGADECSGVPRGESPTGS